MLRIPRPPWWDQARCRTEGRPGWWFSEKRQDTNRAIDVCRRCPARRACAAFALEERIEHGVWGGLTATARDEIRHRAAANV